VTSLNLISEWKWYRISLYILVVGFWPWIARYAIRPQRSEVAVPEADRNEEAQKREADYRAMKAQWWKIALLFVFIEIVVIQQFGVGGITRMVANTLLEIYTLMFGWNMYGAIWDVLVGSGIALVPFIAAIIANFRDNYSNGQAGETIKSMELTLLGMIIVLMLCVIPYKGFSTQLSTVRLRTGCS